MLPICMVNEETLAQVPEDVSLYLRALRRIIERCWITSVPASKPGGTSGRRLPWCRIPPETLRCLGSLQECDPLHRVAVHPALFFSLHSLGSLRERIPPAPSAP